MMNTLHADADADADAAAKQGRQCLLNTHGKTKHGNTADEQLVLLGETDPAGRAEDTILNLGLGLGRSSLYIQQRIDTIIHKHT
jgi:hypothetical protein